jgi:XTP/dITP diphosphohydrolase
MKSLLIATTNPGKLEEFFNLLRSLEVKIFTPTDLGLELQVDETGETYAENAALKAKAYGRASRMITLADDSGLEVEALGGAPGLFSARYALEPNASDADRRAILIKNLQGRPRPWKAAFRAAVAIAVPDANPHRPIRIELFEGLCRGEIIPQERGANGFGYDPVFLLPELNRTMAELTMDEKNHLSHRARAVIAAEPRLKSLLEDDQT